MSTGVVICSKCGREAEQSGDHARQNGWVHWSDKSTLCLGAHADYPETAEAVKEPAPHLLERLAAENNKIGNFDGVTAAEDPRPLNAGKKGGILIPPGSEVIVVNHLGDVTKAIAVAVDKNQILVGGQNDLWRYLPLTMMRHASVRWEGITYTGMVWKQHHLEKDNRTFYEIRIQGI